MIIEIKSKKDNRDYDLGCVDIIAENRSDSFSLGRMSQIMEVNDLDFRHMIKSDSVIIRLPFIKMKKAADHG